MSQPIIECECTEAKCGCDGLCERQADSDVTTGTGVKQLCDRCADEAIQAGYDGWDALDGDLRRALVKWYNVAADDDGDGLDNADRGALLALVKAGRFWFWDCVMCGGRCAHGDPEEWGLFQGVDNQDYESHPGDSDLFTVEARYAMCDGCRSKCYAMPAEGKTPYRGE